MTPQDDATHVDLVVVGAGFAGLYMTHQAQQSGLSVQGIEAAPDVGGTWYWNRYPGARCDIESFDYSYSFDDDLQQQWQWTEKFATQPEILRYLNHVADRFDLRRSFRFGVRVEAATFDETSGLWQVTNSDGSIVTAQFCVLATGCLSSANIPDFDGLEDFRGRTFHTGRWPHEVVDFTNRRIGVIGTGSSGVQCIPMLAQQADEVLVFQRTPNYSLPAFNEPLDPSVIDLRKADYPAYRERARYSFTGVPVDTPTRATFEVTQSERLATYEAAWESGKYGALLRTYTDLMTSRDANDTAAEFVRSKIRAIVHDARTAELLQPDFAFGTKRTCLDTGYFETYNRENVRLIDVRSEPITGLVEDGVVTTRGRFPVDDLVFATGFDAITGAILHIDIRGRGEKSLSDKWSAGPRTYLGLMTAGFPNLFFITGPGSPSVLSNMVVSIEQHVEWISDCVTALIDSGHRTVEATTSAEDAWVQTVNDEANATLYPTTATWYLGANIPDKQRVFMPYVAGVGKYRRLCEQITSDGYRGFAFDADATSESPTMAGA